VVASDLENNTSVDYTPGLRLDGVKVVVIDLLCTSVPACEQKKAKWGSVFRAAGAASWIFSDPAATETLGPLLGGNPQ
jgi:hypothetical protein